MFSGIYAMNVANYLNVCKTLQESIIYFKMLGVYINIVKIPYISELSNSSDRAAQLNLLDRAVM